ncbi:Tar ligand binding domain-containing protein [Pseudoalteromonas lipolytica]|uniref:Tar ligand binding domain-containing protein n=1 Tax=Pseudoalteromonas lipolytica TaxID=570156 RepID=UPI001427AF54
MNNLTIRKKVYLLGFSILFLLTLIGGISIYSMNKISKELDDIAKENIPLSKAISKISGHQLQQTVVF